MHHDLRGAAAAAAALAARSATGGQQQRQQQQQQQQQVPRSGSTPPHTPVYPPAPERQPSSSGPTPPRPSSPHEAIHTQEASPFLSMGLQVISPPPPGTATAGDIPPPPDTAGGMLDAAYACHPGVTSSAVTGVAHSLAARQHAAAEQLALQAQRDMHSWGGSVAEAYTAGAAAACVAG